MAFDHLFRSGRIGNAVLKNRLVMAPMGDGLIGFMGTHSDRAIDYYERRAMGGVGLIVTSLALVDSKVEPWEINGEPPLVTFNNAMKIRNFLKLTERVHDFGTRIFAQLTAGFGRVYPPIMLEIAKGTPIAPSTQPLFWDPAIQARELKVEEIETLIAAFGQAAVIARESGFDGIEIHGHEGYLIDQFTSALWNRRTDAYGGALAGRMRFSLSIIRAIQRAAGDDFPICYRYGIEHKLEGGRTAEESIAMARMLEEAGVAALHVDAGCYDNWHWPHPPIYQPPGCMVDMAAAVKPHVRIPVIAVGRLGYPELADSVLERGLADFIALGRPLIADPDFPRKAQQGRVETIRPCIGCHVCLGRIVRMRSLSCAVNPECGDEQRLAIAPAPASRRVLVLGGGIAGLEAARVSALRGHRVTLLEKTDRLGGLLHIAGAPAFKQDIARLLAFKQQEISALPNLTLRLNTEATRENIAAHAPDVVVIATGSRCLNAGDIGLECEAGARVFCQNDAFLDRLGKTTGSVLIIGGGSVGCEAGLHLAMQGWSVTIVEQLAEAAADLHEANREMLLELLERHQVRLVLETRVTRITKAGAMTEKGSLAADAVVLAVGSRPINELTELARALVPEVLVVGDCLTPGTIQAAIWSAFKQTRIL